MAFLAFSPSAPWAELRFCPSALARSFLTPLSVSIYLYLSQALASAVLFQQHPDGAAFVVQLSSRISELSIFFQSSWTSSTFPVPSSSSSSDTCASLTNDTSYRIVIDAGSTGSRANVYGLPSMTRLGTKKSMPGLSTFRDNPHESWQRFKKLFDYAKDVIPDD